MKTINIDKLLTLTLIIGLDITLIFLFHELIKTFDAENYSFKMISLCILFIGFLPFVISSHFKNISNGVKEKLLCTSMISSSFLLGIFAISNTDFTEGKSILQNTFDLFTGIIFISIGVLTFVKTVFDKKQKIYNK